LRLELDLVAQQPATISGADLPQPAATDYPGDVPYVFQHLAGGFSVVASRAEFATFQLTVKNLLDVRFMASQYGLPVANGQKTTLSWSLARRGRIALFRRAEQPLYLPFNFRCIDAHRRPP
jgi:hypothetical protein